MGNKSALIEKAFTNFFGISNEHCLANEAENFVLIDAPDDLQALISSEANMLQVAYDFEILA